MLHDLKRWTVAAIVVASYFVVLAAVVIVERVKALARRATPARVRTRLARRRAHLAYERSRRTAEGVAARPLSIRSVATETAEGIVGPATRARLLGVDELMLDDSEERALFI